MRNKVSRVGQEFKALLFTQGLIDLEDDTVVCSTWLLQKLNEVASADYSYDFYYSLEQYAQQWLQLNDRMKTVETRLAKQANEDNGLQMLYESVPGIGFIHARQLVNELEDMKQFKNEKQLFSYLGLTPSEHSSGEHTRQGHITRQGKSVLRKILIEAAWIAIYKDRNLGDIFQHLSKSRGKKRAIVGIARRLAGRIRTCVITGELYQIKETQEVDTLLKTVT
jgi:transposase